MTWWKRVYVYYVYLLNRHTVLVYETAYRAYIKFPFVCSGSGDEESVMVIYSMYYNNFFALQNKFTQTLESIINQMM